MDSETPITDAEMVQKLITHMGKTGLVSRPFMKFKTVSAANRTWKKGKDYFIEALADTEDIKKATGEEGLYANYATRKNIGPHIEQKVREEMATNLGESFETLACAATIKSDTMDNHTRIITTLSASRDRVD